MLRSIAPIFRRNAISPSRITQRVQLRRFSFFKPPTLLHQIIQNHPDPEIIEAHLKCIPTDDVINMLMTVDNKGRTPIDLLPTHPYYLSKQLRTRLINLVANNPKIKPLNELMPIDPGLDANTRWAYEVINETRNHIHASYTHPDYNHLTLVQKNKLDLSIEVMRTRIRISTNLADLLSVIIKCFSLCQESKTGNCGEYNYIAMMYLIMKAIQANQEIWLGTVSIPNGHHVFTMWDFNPLMNANNYLITDTNAMFIDAWAGAAGLFNKDHLFTKIKCYRRYELPTGEGFKNTFVNFNPEYHQVEIIAQLHFNPREFKNSVHYPGFFNCYASVVNEQIPGLNNIPQKKTGP